MIYLVENGAMQTTGAKPSVATGTALKTLLQLKPGTTSLFRILEWGISFDGSAAATPGKVELLEVDVAATVTAFVANDITKLDGDALLAGDPTTNIVAVGTTSSGYTATAEGTVTVSRDLDGSQLIAPTNQYIKQFPLGQEPVIQPGKFCRIRVTFSTTVNAYCFIKFQA